MSASVQSADPTQVDAHRRTFRSGPAVQLGSTQDGPRSALNALNEVAEIEQQMPASTRAEQ
jgi:hypothetical protein